MALSFKHAFTSSKGDPGDATLIRPSNWNAEHVLTAAANVLLGCVGAGSVSEISCTAVGRAVIGAADAAAQRTALGLGTGDSPAFTNASLTGVLKASSGAVGAPAHSFTADLTTGAYFVAGHYNISIAGVKVVDVSAALVAITGALSTTTSVTAGNGLTVTAGAVSLPAGSVANAALASPAPVLLATLTASNSAQLADTTSLTAAYKKYKIYLNNILPATNSVTCRLKVNVGGVQSLNYDCQINTNTNGTNIPEQPTTCIQLSRTTQLKNSGQGLCAEITLFNPAQSSSPKTFIGHGAYPDVGGASMGITTVGGAYTGSNAAVTGIQLDMSTGNITSGTVEIYGIP